MMMYPISAPPWKDSGNIGFGRWITADDGTQVAVSYGPTINHRCASNTRLIVAAPDLLQALHNLLDWMVARAEVDGSALAADLFEREPEVIAARAAIAKAEGEVR